MWKGLSELLPQTLKRAGIEKSVSDAVVCDSFSDIAKNLIGESAEHCKALYIKDSILWVAVLSSSVSSELSIYEHDIIQALSDEFGSGKVVKVRYVQ